MRIRANAIANYAGQGWTTLIAFVAIPVYVHLLGIEAFALVGFLTMLQTWLSILDLGVMPTAVREMARFSGGESTAERVRDLLRSFETVCIVIASMLIVVFLALSGTIARDWLDARAVSESVVSSAVSLMGVVIAARLVESMYRSCLIGLQRQVWLNTATAALATLRTLGAIAVLLWVERTITAFFIWQAVVSLIAICVLGGAVHGDLPPSSRRARFSGEVLASVGKFAAGAAGTNFLVLLLTQTDKLILSRLLPLGEFGYYMIAATISGLLYSLIMPLTQAVYPAMVGQVGAQRTMDLTDTFHAGSRAASAILAPAALLLVAFPDEILFAWSGDPLIVDSAAPLTALLTIGTLFNTLMHMPYYLQLAHGRTRLALFANLAAAITLVPALLLLVPRDGSVAAAEVWAVLNLFYFLVVAPLMFRGILPSEMWRWYLSDIAKPLLAATAAILVVRFVPLDMELGRFGQALHVGLAGALGVLASLLGADLLRIRRTLNAIRPSDDAEGRL